jgi:hypothetical protein
MVKSAKSGLALGAALAVLWGTASSADAAVPETTIDSGPPDISRQARPVFAFSSPDAGATFECAIDDDGFAPCASPHTTAPLSQGTYRFRVRAVDGEDEDPTPAERTFTIDRNITGANARGRRVQRIERRRVTLTISVRAAEHVLAFAAGKVRLDKRRTYAFASPEASIDAGVQRRLVLTSRKASASRKIRRALKRGKDVHATLTATFTDDIGNRATTGDIEVELRR